jgi:hypothetical protein
MKISRILGLVLFLALPVTSRQMIVSHADFALQGDIYYVATDGSDTTGDGSSSKPWATITHALDNVPDGSTVLVRPGTYVGRVHLRGSFAQGVTVRSEVPYQARLRNDDRVITSYDGCQGIILEDFDIAHSGDGADPLVIHLDGGGGNGYVSRITLRNSVLHDSYDNDILKINNGAEQITVEGNIFYNQSGSDEHIDVNSVTDVVIQDNIFFNDFAGSGRTDDDTSSFVVIKDSNGSSDNQLGSEHIVVRRNIFLHWEGSDGQGFVRVGEDGTANYEAIDVLVENNLMIGNNTQQIRSPFQVMGAYSVTIRANTVAGDMLAKEYGARIFTYGANPDNDQIHLHNNIWSDPTGTMGDTFNRGNNTNNLTFDNNLFWNNGNLFPTSLESIIEVSDDVHRIEGDPLLGDQAGLALPRWNPSTGQFADGSTTIRQAFERLVRDYGTPAASSPAIDAADPSNSPSDDILGSPRPAGSAPDIGASEFIPTLILKGAAADQAIRLTWTVNTTLPTTTTWQIVYDGPAGDQPSPITGIIAPTRTFTLTGLTNYIWYNVTLNAILDGAPLLTDTITTMPTDRFVYLPLVLKEP